MGTAASRTVKIQPFEQCVLSLGAFKNSGETREAYFGIPNSNLEGTFLDRFEEDGSGPLPLMHDNEEPGVETHEPPKTGTASWERIYREMMLPTQPFGYSWQILATSIAHATPPQNPMTLP